MKDQEFIDITLGKDEPLGAYLNEIVAKKREESGSHAIYVQDVVQTYENRYTIILEINETNY